MKNFCNSNFKKNIDKNDGGASSRRFSENVVLYFEQLQD